MKLTGVTLTGVDDNIDPSWLDAASAEFPFAEFGVLLSLSRQGREPRYPTSQWIGRLGRITAKVKLAAHLCGQAARDVAAGEGDVLDALRGGFQRVQLNGVRPTAELANLIFPYYTDIEFVLQASTLTELDFADQYLASGAWPNVSILFDPSGGRGLPVMGALQTHSRLLPIPSQTSRIGYAGGIGPDNVSDVCHQIRQMEHFHRRSDIPYGCADYRTWIDMESGIRTDDRFDPHKAVEVLKAARPYVERA